MKRGVFVFALASVLAACGGGDDVPDGSCRAGTEPGVRHNGIFGLVDLGSTKICITCEPGSYCPGGDLRGEPCVGDTWDHDQNPATDCEPKRTCVPGTYVTSADDRVHDRICAPCAAGTFTRDVNQRSCTPWEPGMCQPGTVPTQNATGDCAFCPSGTYCPGEGPPIPCPPGTWDDDGNASTVCVAWSTCHPGQYVTAMDGTATSDRGCEECPGDTFSTTSMATACTPRATCPVDSYVVVAPRPDTDRTCAPCPAGLHTPTSTSATCSAVQAIAAGSTQSCATTTDHGVKCWGALGAPPSVSGVVPATIPNSGTFHGVAPGRSHACALDATNAVWCWGTADFFQLGPDQREATGTPVQPFPSFTPVQLASSRTETLARSANGQVYFWGGFHDDGTLGGFTPTTSGWPIEELTGAFDLAIYDGNYCGVVYDAAVRCTTPDRGVDEQPVPGAVRAAAGWGHVCALTKTGEVVCFGSGLRGELGTGVHDLLQPPTTVPGISGASAVVSGAFHVCALTGGQVTCWGANDKGQLGDGTTTDRGVPAVVPGLTGIVAIAAGAMHTCALAVDGAISCWGDNAAGQLGDGTTTTRLSPTRVVGF